MSANEHKNKKILMIAATPFFSDRGCHIRIYNEIKYLKKEGVDVTLCTYHLGKNIEDFEINRIPNVSWYKKITPGASWGKIYLDFLLLKLSSKEYLKNKPEIIHAHLYEGLFIAWLVKVLNFSKVKIIFDCQGSLAEEMYTYTLHKSIFLKPFYYFFMLIEKLLLYMPDKIFCSSKNSYDFLVSKYKISKNKIDIINDGIDTDLFNNSLYNKDTVKTVLNIPIQNTIILYTGSISKAKGVKELLDAIPKIIEKRKNITFIFSGYGNLEDEYKEKLKEYVKSTNVIFIGRFSYFDLPKYTIVADYAIDPKKDSSESSGKLLNYVGAGLPVICFKNEFNVGLLGEGGLYINDFSDIVDIHETKRVKQRDISELSWKKIIKNLTSAY
jgi:glycosyltransferase involved in cell wall biosynthesis